MWDVVAKNWPGYWLDKERGEHVFPHPGEPPAGQVITTRVPVGVIPDDLQSLEAAAIKLSLVHWLHQCSLDPWFLVSCREFVDYPEAWSGIAQVRHQYRVPAFRGTEVAIYVRPGKYYLMPQLVLRGRITSSEGAHIWVKSEGARTPSGGYHPTEGVVYLRPDSSVWVDTRIGLKGVPRYLRAAPQHLDSLGVRRNCSEPAHVEV